MVTPERLEQLKKILGVTDPAKDDLFTFELELVEDQILAYINQDVLPEQLERPLVMIAAAHWKSAGYGKEQVAAGPVTSVKRGDVTTSFAAAAGADASSGRRFRILTKATEQRPFTLRRLKELMTTLCGEDGFTVAMVGSTFTLTVRVMLKVKQNYDDVETLLNRIVPENLILDLSLMYNQHQTLAAFTHAQLAAYTHYFLRNEVLPHGNN